MTDHLTDSERALRQAAEKATKGEWRQHLVDETTVVSNSRLVDVCCTAPADYGTDEQVDYETDAEQCEANAAYIVAAQPSAVLALIAELRAAREALKRIAEERPYRSGYGEADIDYEPALTAYEAMHAARAALAGDRHDD